MSHIFISYASEDREKTDSLATALQAEGWSVWWDRTIPAGMTFSQVIEQALRDAGCVLVLWSVNSINSHWVRDEAENARDRGILVPVLLDETLPPIGFRSIQAAALQHWDGRHSSREFRNLVRDIERILGSSEAASQREEAVRLKEHSSNAIAAASQPTGQPAKGVLKPELSPFARFQPPTRIGWVRIHTSVQLTCGILSLLGSFFAWMLGDLAPTYPGVIGFIFVGIPASLILGKLSWQLRLLRGVIQGWVMPIVTIDIVGLGLLLNEELQYEYSDEFLTKVAAISFLAASVLLIASAVLTLVNIRTTRADRV